MNINNYFYDVTEWNKSEKEKSTKWTYPNPEKESNWKNHGFIEFSTHTVNALGWWGIRFKAQKSYNEKVKIRLFCSINRNPATEAIKVVETELFLTQNNINFVPFTSFNFDLGMSILLKGIFSIEIVSENKKNIIETFEIIKSPLIAIHTEIKGKALKKDYVTYEFLLKNTTKEICSAQIFQNKQGWEVLPVTIFVKEEEAAITSIVLAPYEEKKVFLRVDDNKRFGELGHEKHVIQIVDSLGFQQQLEFITSREYLDYSTTLSSQNIMEIKEKINKYEWAKEKYQLLYEQADNWEVPEIDIKLPYLFLTRESDEASNAALIYLISGERKFGEKAANFLKEFVHSEKGYLNLPHAGNQELVHEGEFFKHTALAYDRLKGSLLLEKEDKKKIEKSFRIFMDIITDECQKGKISNWNLAELSGVITCAAALQDVERIDYFIHCQGGVLEHISKGILNDGWWYEASIGYNLLAMGLFLEISQTINKWGYQLHTQKISANYANYFDINQKNLDETDKIDGLSTEVWGSTENNTRSIEMLTDSMVSFFDNSGVIFGMNDSEESRVVGINLLDPRYDLAYQLYQKSDYLPLLHNVLNKDRDLCFGIGELPELTEEDKKIHTKSEIAEIAGIAMLRSQKEGRSYREQYQVTMKSGILGGAHGHYDRLALNSIRRFGKSFYNPENVWYAYHTFMYKFYVQNSITHNMVTVDLKQQDPKEVKILSFYSDKQLQYTVQEIKTKWCNPPYGGWRVGQNETFSERCWNEGRELYIPEKTPKYTERTEFTEDVLQRRAVIVTDDYVVVVDYLEGNDIHDFDCLYHGSGLKGLLSHGYIAETKLSSDKLDARHFLISENINYQKTTEKLDTNPLSSGQFITDCHWFNSNDSIKASFSIDMSRYNDKGWLTALRTSENEKGMLNLDIHYPAIEQKEIFVGMEPEYYQTQQQLFYSIGTEDRELYSSRMGTWIFGKDEINVDIPKDTNKLILQTRTKYVANEYGSGKDVPEPSIFWAEGVIETVDGKLISIKELPMEIEKIVPVPMENRDYFGGPIKIQTQKIEEALPGTPVSEDETGLIIIDLKDIDAKSIKIIIGGDYPLGSEKDHRRIIGVRQRGKSAKFVTVLEQFEKDNLIETVELEKNEVIVNLKDGNKDVISIKDWKLANAGISLIKSNKK